MGSADYDGRSISVAPWPRGISAGGGWWRFTLHIDHDAMTDVEQFCPPRPGGELDDLQVVIALVFVSRSHTRLEALLRSETMDPGEITYISILLQELQEYAGPLVIEGFKDHPILNVSRRSGAP